MVKDVEVNHDDILKLRKSTATKNNEYWSEDEKEKLVRMHGEGYGISEWRFTLAGVKVPL